jgi:regulatory protein
MSVVTSLRATRRGKVSLHVDGEFVCSVSESFVARWRLFQGRELDDEALSQLRSQAATERVAGDAYRLLGHRARSRHELQERLLQKGHEEQDVTAVLERLAADNLLDDAEFARCYVADKRGLSGWGAQRIRRGLVALGVAGDVIDAALGETVRGTEGHDAEFQRALGFLRRKGAPRPPLEAAKRRAFQALQRRGFANEVCYAALKRWIVEAAPAAEDAEAPPN